MKSRYIIFHKPYGYLSQFTPEGNHPGLNEFQIPKEVYPVGRLDHDSEGLLLLSNDGEFIKKILEPDQNKFKSYWVQVDGIPSEESLSILRRGDIKIQDYLTRPCQVSIEQLTIPPRNPPIRVRKNIPTTWLNINLYEGKNRQIRKMTASIGHPTLRLIRHRIHRYELGQLRPGQWLEVDRLE